MSAKISLYFTSSGEQVTIEGKTIAGRIADLCDLHLTKYFKIGNLLDISREHFQIYPNPDGSPTFVIQDLGSTNGTEVDGEGLSPCKDKNSHECSKPLHHRSKVRLAKNENFTIEIFYDLSGTTSVVDGLSQSVLYFDQAQHQFVVDGKAIPDHHLAPRQKELLQYLARNAGRVCSDDELIEKVWLGADVQNNTVAGAIGRLCKKLDRVSSGASDYIERVYGRGYRLKRVSGNSR